MNRDDAYVVDMRVAAVRARRFVAGMTREEFERSEVHQEAVVRMLQVLGEAARKVSDATKLAHPEVPWKLVVGMRHILVHEYFRIDQRVVWDTVQADLPDVLRALEAWGPLPGRDGGG